MKDPTRFLTEDGCICWCIMWIEVLAAQLPDRRTAWTSLESRSMNLASREKRDRLKALLKGKDPKQIQVEEKTERAKRSGRRRFEGRKLAESAVCILDGGAYPAYLRNLGMSSELEEGIGGDRCPEGAGILRVLEDQGKYEAVQRIQLSIMLSQLV